MQLTKGEKTSELVGDFSGVAHLISAQLEGRKVWVTPKKLRFETTAHNLRTLASIFKEIAADVETSPELVSKHPGGVVPQFRLPPRDYQLASFEKLKALHAIALFSEPGTGKTKTIIDIICYRAVLGELTGVLVLSNPKGVHAQWVTEQLPQHMWSNVPWDATFWNGRTRPNWMNWNETHLQIFSGNIDMLRSDKAFGILQTFCAAHQGKLMIVVDESQSIKSRRIKRTQRLQMLAAQYHCRQRAIMTGTPIAKDLTDEWSQFYFLDPNIIGHRYQTSFRAQYCIMGGYEDKHVVGHKNLEHFKQLTAPYIFRARKSELNLPEKIYDHIEFDLSDEQKKIIKSIKDTQLADIGNTRISAAHAAAAVLRISQISCGFSIDENDHTVTLQENPRIEALKLLLSQLEGKVIIWCRFRFDVATIVSNTPGLGASIYGATLEKDRLFAKRQFIENPACKYLIATPDTAGQGLDGLQTVCENAIYYSNGYNAVVRWQSEDRIHRLGMKGAASYYDLIARGSPDRAILRNLRNKKTLSTLVLDDIKELIKEIDQ